MPGASGSTETLYYTPTRWWLPKKSYAWVPDGRGYAPDRSARRALQRSSCSWGAEPRLTAHRVTRQTAQSNVPPRSPISHYISPRRLLCACVIYCYRYPRRPRALSAFGRLGAACALLAAQQRQPEEPSEKGNNTSSACRKKRARGWQSEQAALMGARGARMRSHTPSRWRTLACGCAHRPC